MLRYLPRYLLGIVPSHTTIRILRKLLLVELMATLCHHSHHLCINQSPTHAE